MKKGQTKINLVEMERLLKEGYTYSAIAKKFNSSLNNVRYLAKAYGLDKYNKHKRLAHLIKPETIKNHLQEGLSYADIGKIYGYSGSTIGALSSQYGLDQYNNTNHYKYIDLDDVKSMLLDGESYFGIASKLGVGESYIRKLCISNDLAKYNINIRTPYEIYPVNSAIKAYILGFILCDSSINLDNSVKLKISAIDVNTLYLIANEFGVDVYIDTTKANKNGNCSDIIRVIKAIKDIDKIFKGRLKPDRVPPFEIIPEEYLRYFIRGIIEADGTIYINTDISKFHIDIYSPKNIIYPVASFLLNYLGIETYIQEIPGAMRLSIYSMDSAWRLLNWIYPVNDFITMQRKYNNAMILLKYISYRKIDINDKYIYNNTIKPFTINTSN